MKLSRLERLMLSNQYRILEKLYPDEMAGKFEKTRLALERGYTLLYSVGMNHIHDEFKEEECREASNILDMYRALTDAYNNLEDKSGIDESKVKFPGFDGNDEAAQLSYVTFLIEEENRFQELDRGKGFDSRYPMLPQYRSMLEKWKGVGEELSKDEFLDLLGIEV